MCFRRCSPEGVSVSIIALYLVSVIDAAVFPSSPPLNTALQSAANYSRRRRRYMRLTGFVWLFLSRITPNVVRPTNFVGFLKSKIFSLYGADVTNALSLSGHHFILMSTVMFLSE